MARMKREAAEPVMRMDTESYPDVFAPEPVAEPVADAKTVALAPAIPTGYVAREIVWPAQYWRVFDRQAARGGLSTSEYLRRLLAHMARE